MNMTEDGVGRGLGPAKPLFNSSWLALFLLLRQEFESLREEDAPDAASGAEVDQRDDRTPRHN